MSFDQNQPDGPIIHLEKKTTKVNVAVVIGVLAFFVAALAIGFWAWDRDGRNNAEPVPAEKLPGP
jgi:hypothetical protein